MIEAYRLKMLAEYEKLGLQRDFSHNTLTSEVELMRIQLQIQFAGLQALQSQIDDSPDNPEYAANLKEKLAELQINWTKQIEDYNEHAAFVKEDLEKELHNVEQQTAADLKTLNKILDKTKQFYHFEITLMKLMAYGSHVIPEEEVHNALNNNDSIKAYLNAHPDFLHDNPSIIELLAKSRMFHSLPEPTQEDTGYKIFYDTLRTLRMQSLLAHRFNINGTVKKDNITFDLHGGYQEVMVPQMSESFTHFLNTTGQMQITSMLMDSEYGALGKTLLDQLLQTVSEDVNQCVLTSAKEMIDTHIEKSNTLLLAPTIKPTADAITHAISLSFHNNLCFISDKESENPGMTIYTSTLSTAQLKQVQKEIATEINQNMLLPADAPLVTFEQFSEKIISKCHLEPLAFVKLQAQYGDNCTWSSSAKSVLLSALYAHLYDAAMQLPEIHQKKACELAGFYAKKIQNLWAHEDKLSFLQNYIETAKSDPVLLAYIYLKTQYSNKDIAELIKQHKLVKPEHIQEAKLMAYKQVEHVLKQELGKEVYENLCEEYMETFSDFITKLCDLRFVSNKSNIERVYKTLRFATQEDFENNLEILDNEIKQAKKAKTSILKETPLHASRKTFIPYHQTQTTPTTTSTTTLSERNEKSVSKKPK